MRIRRQFLSVLIAILACCPGASGQAPSWTRWRGPNGDGISSETGWNPAALAGGARVAWKADIGAGYSDVVIEAGRLYTMGLVKWKWTVHCLDAVTGAPVWQRQFDSMLDPVTTPCVDADRVYCLGKDGTIVCLRTSDGSLLWRRSLKDDFGLPRPNYGWGSSPVVEGELLLLSAGFAGMALDKMTGTLAWSSTQMPGEGKGTYGHYATPVVYDFDGKRCALFFGDSSLSGVDLATGQRVWTWPHGDKHPISDPIVSGSTVFVSRPAATLLEMAPGAPRTVWTNSELTTAAFTAVLVDGYVYGSNKGTRSFGEQAWDDYGAPSFPVRCMELSTGTIRWESGKMQFTTSCVAGGRLILLELGGTLHIAEASPAAYRELSSADVLDGAKRPRRFAVPPVLCGGRIYCRNYAGDLVCIDVRQ